MADEEVLKEEINKLEEQSKVLANELQTVLGIDCSFGACVFDPEMTDIEAKLAEVQNRKATLEKIMNTVKTCNT